jgi:hypothetical protein
VTLPVAVATNKIDKAIPITEISFFIVLKLVEYLLKIVYSDNIDRLSPLIVDRHHNSYTLSKPKYDYCAFLTPILDLGCMVDELNQLYRGVRGKGKVTVHENVPH